MVMGKEINGSCNGADSNEAELAGHRLTPRYGDRRGGSACCL